MAKALSAGNKFIVCQYAENVATFGHWVRRNPLEYTVPLLLLQLCLISLTSTAIDLCLRPLAQSSIVSQILSGILAGPSLLSHRAVLGAAIFPARSIVILETIAVFGIMFFFFAIGVRSDTRLMVRPSRQATIIGVSAMSTTLISTTILYFVLKTFVSMDQALATGLPFVAMSQTLTPFPNIACLLGELKMTSSDLGQIATSSSMLCDIFGISLTAILIGLAQSASHPIKAVFPIGSVMLFVIIMVFAVRPIVSKVVKSIPPVKSLPDRYVMFCFLGTLFSASISEMIGQHYVLGPLLFGLLVPDGQPLGSAIIAKLDYFVGKFLYPTFLTTSGLKTNIFKIELRSFLVVMCVFVFACLSKITAIVLASRLYGIKFRDAVTLGLMMNAKGICELVVYNFWLDNGLLTDQVFAASVICVAGVTAIIAPLIKLLYDPSRRLAPLKRRTIQHTKRDTELRILVCIQNQENVPSIINLLEASDATQESPIAVIAVLLIELVGRATPMLVAHQSTRNLPPTDSKSCQIINALRQYEFCNESCVTIQPFSAISHINTTHDDICRVALDQSATIVILPFHKRWEIDGSIGSENRAMQSMNIKVLERAPCSVGILIDRGILTGSLSILNNKSDYQVAVIHIGGSDDAEALYYGARMVQHKNVNVTLFRFLLFGCDNARERKQDNNMIDEVRQANIGNEKFMYQERLVKDGVGLAASLRDLENNYNLLLVGRRHQASQILMGLDAWSECPELGVVGDILASSDFRTTASVLVVQQQRLAGGKFKNRLMNKPVVVNYEAPHDQPVIIGSAAPAVVSDYDTRWEIAIDKDRT